MQTHIHFNHAWIIWLLFLIGEGLHVFLQVDDLARKNNLLRRNVITTVLAPVLYRAFGCAMIFALIWQHPDIIAKVAGFFGHPVSGDEEGVFRIPMNYAISGLYGLGLDSALGYIPVLKTQLPSVTVSEIKQTTTLTQTTTTTPPKGGA